MILDEEVFAVILAITIVASVFSIAMVLRPRVVEPFIAIGLLDEHCKIGNYPKYVVPNQTVKLCIFVHNYLGKPVYWRVVYKIGDNSSIPTNTSPSLRRPLAWWSGVLDHNQNTTFVVNVPIEIPKDLGGRKRIALIFELWIYNTSSNRWVYTGRWTHLYVEVVKR